METQVYQIESLLKAKLSDCAVTFMGTSISAGEAASSRGGMPVFWQQGLAMLVMAVPGNWGQGVSLEADRTALCGCRLTIDDNQAKYYVLLSSLFNGVEAAQKLSQSPGSIELVDILEPVNIGVHTELFGSRNEPSPAEILFGQR